MIQIINVNKKIKNQDLFSDLNLIIPEKRITAFIGQSGSGKTTLLDIIFNQTKYQGKVVIDNEIYHSNTLSVANKVSYQSNYDVLFENETVDRNLKFACPNLSESKIIYFLKRYNLINSRYKKIKELSGGQKQTVKILQCILSDSDYMLFDEPTASLDTKLIKVFNEDILSLRNNKGIIIATHDENIIKLADKVVDLEDLQEDKIEETSFEVAKPRKDYQKRSINYNFTRLVTNLFSVFMTIIFTLVFFISLSNSMTFSKNVKIGEDEIVFQNIYSNDYYLTPNEAYKLFNECDAIDEFANTIDCTDTVKFLDSNITCNYLPIDGYSQENNLKRIPLKTTSKIQQGKNRKIIKNDAQIIISQKIYDAICEIAKKMNIKNISLDNLVFNEYFHAVDVFDDEDYKISFSRNYYYYSLTQSFNNNDCFYDFEFINDYPQNVVKNYDMYISEDVIKIFQSVINSFDYENKTFKIIDETNKIYVPDLEFYQLIKKNKIHGSETIELPYENQVIVEGDKPQQEKVLWPSYCKENNNFSMEPSLISGYYEDEFSYRRYIYKLIDKTDFYQKIKPFNSIRVNDLEKAKQYLDDNNFNYLTFENNVDRLNEMSHKFVTSGVIYIFGSVLVDLVFIIIVEMLHEQKIKRELFFGQDQSALATNEFKAHISSLLVTSISIDGLLFGILLIYSLINKLTLNYAIWVATYMIMRIIIEIIVYLIQKMIVAKKKYRFGR